jgi:hypothetical protein
LGWLGPLRPGCLSLKNIIIISFSFEFQKKIREEKDVREKERGQPK